MSVNESGGEAIVLSGPVTLYESAATREALLSAVGEGRDFRLNLEASGPWDMAGLQLLIATVASARQAGVNVRLEQVPAVCREAAERSGLGAWLDGVTGSYV